MISHFKQSCTRHHRKNIRNRRTRVQVVILFGNLCLSFASDNKTQNSRAWQNHERLNTRVSDFFDRYPSEKTKSKIMRLCDFLFCILLISFVRCFPTSQPIPRPRGLLIVRLSPTSTRQDVTNAWRTVDNPAFKAPQVQIYMLKGHVSPDQNWAYSNEYKYSNQYYEEITTKKPSFIIDYQTTEKPESGNRVDAEKNKGNPSLESRNIIDPPTHCPKGSAPDSNNKCRELVE